MLTRASGLSDDGVVRVFEDLGRTNPGKRIVEKTPGHIFHIDRARRLLKPAVLCTIRDPIDVVASMLKVGRNPDAWWKSAPKSVEAAAKLARRYHLAVEAVLKDGKTVPVPYAHLYADTRESLKEIQTKVGLSNDHLDGQMAFSSNRDNVPFEGVWNDGSPGAGLRELSEEERGIAEKIIGADLVRDMRRQATAWPG